MTTTETPEFSSFRLTLADLLSANNDARNKAEEIYDGIPANNKMFLLLTAVSTNGISPEEAELAAILLRRLFCAEFKGSFIKLTLDAQMQIKNQLLHQIQQNIARNLRKKIGEAAAELARNCIDDDGNNHWPEFLKFLFNAACSSDPDLKEVALLMFADVPGLFGNQQNKYIHIIEQMLSSSLSDQCNLDVRFAAMKATSSFMLANEKETAVLKQLSQGACVELIFQFLSQMFDDADERTNDLLLHLVDLVAACPQCFRSSIDVLFFVCLEMMAKNLDTTCRLASEVLVTLAESAPAMVRKLASKHIPTLIFIIFTLMVDIQDDPDWDTDEDISDDENSNNVVGEAALDRLACALGGKALLPIVMNALTTLLSDSNWKKRYAGLMAISAVGEGCHKPMLNLLNQIVDGVLPFIDDSHTRVRYAACNALGQMSSDFAPTLQKTCGQKVVCALLKLLEDPSSPRVQAHAGAAFVNFFDDCPKNVLNPFMNRIADSLEAVLNSKIKEFVEKGTKLVLEQVVVTTAALADCAEEKFQNYYERFMPSLRFIIQNAVNPDCRLLRGKTIECISLIGLAVGKDQFMAHAEEVMDLLLKAQVNDVPLADDDPQLSYMIGAWARICKILGKGFEPYLPHVMQPVLKAASVKPEIAVHVDDMNSVENDDDWEFVNLVGKQNFGIRTAGLEDKATACQLLVCYAKELKEGFTPYVEETLKLMVPMLKFYFHDGVRTAAAEILPYLLESSKIRGDSFVEEMWRYIIIPFLQAIEYEPEPEVLCTEMAAFSQCIEVLNYKCLTHEEMMVLINCLNKKILDHFLKEELRDQKRNEEDYDEVLEETLEEEDDHDIYVLSKISDTVSTLFSVYKQDFLPYFDVLLQQYTLLLEPYKSPADRLWALCVFADVIEYGGPACSKYQQYFMQPMLQSLSHENSDLRQTAAYAVGCLGQFGGPEFNKICAESLPVLIQIINATDSRSEENIKATENAISAVGKFLMYSNSLINMDEIIPMWISWLPIWEDEEEAKFCLNFLCSLIETNNPLILGKDNCNVPHITQIVAEAFYKEAVTVTSDVGRRMVFLIKSIQTNTELFTACVNSLTPYQQEALHTALTTQ